MKITLFDIDRFERAFWIQILNIGFNGYTGRSLFMFEKDWNKLYLQLLFIKIL